MNAPEIYVMVSHYVEECLLYFLSSEKKCSSQFHFVQNFISHGNYMLWNIAKSSVCSMSHYEISIEGYGFSHIKIYKTKAATFTPSHITRTLTHQVLFRFSQHLQYNHHVFSTQIMCFNNLPNSWCMHSGVYINMQGR